MTPDNVRTSNEADALGASGHAEDVLKWIKNLDNSSERANKHLEQVGEKSLPRKTPYDPNKPGNETPTPGNIHSVQGRY